MRKIHINHDVQGRKKMKNKDLGSSAVAIEKLIPSNNGLD